MGKQTDRITYEDMSVEYPEFFCRIDGGHGGVAVINTPPTSEDGGSNPGPYVGKLVVAY